MGALLDRAFFPAADRAIATLLLEDAKSKKVATAELHSHIPHLTLPDHAAG
jgi:hypothetical protein